MENNLTKLKLSNIQAHQVLNCNGLSLGAIGLFFLLQKTYSDIFYFESALKLSHKKAYTEADITKHIDELINRHFIEIC